MQDFVFLYFLLLKVRAIVHAQEIYSPVLTLSGSSFSFTGVLMFCNLFAF